MDDRNRVMKRSLINYLIRPSLQTKIGLYYILLSFLFSAFTAWIIYFNFRDLFVSILELTDASKEVQEIMEARWIDIQFWIYGAMATYIAATITLSIWYTHRFVGPAVAFTKHLKAIAQGDYAHRTYLRKGDAFTEIGEGLNLASEALEKLKLNALSSDLSNTNPKGHSADRVAL